MKKSLRAIFSSANFLAVLALLGVLFIMVNYIASRRYARWDFTRQKITALSQKTVRTLAALTQPVSITVFYQPNERLYPLIQDQLQEYARLSPRVKVEYVDPDQDIARARQLVQEFQVENTNVVVFQCGARHQHLSDGDLAEYDYGSAAMGSEPRIDAFKGEEAFTSALLNVTQDAAPLLWFISGHGEKSIESEGEERNLSELTRYLERQNFSVKTVTLLEQANIPEEVKLVVIAGPRRRFTETELGVLQQYLTRGGKCLALIDPLEDSGLDGLLRQWGLELGLDIVIDPARPLPFVSPTNLLVTVEASRHPMLRNMPNLVMLFPLTRSVRPATPAPEGVIVTPLALTSPKGWGETQTAVKTFAFDPGQDVKGPVSVAAAVERATPAPQNVQALGAQDAMSQAAAGRTRIVVVGDSDFVVNGQLGNVGNRDFLMGAIRWLVEQEQLIGISAKTIESIKLSLTGPQLMGIFWFSLLALPLGYGLLGVVVWWLRRS